MSRCSIVYGVVYNACYTAVAFLLSCSAQLLRVVVVGSRCEWWSCHPSLPDTEAGQRRILHPDGDDIQRSIWTHRFLLRSVYPSVCTIICLSKTLSLSLSLSLSMSVSVSPSLSVYVCLCLYVSVCLCLSLCRPIVCMSFNQLVIIFLFVYVSVQLSVCVCPSVLFICLSVCLPICMSTIESICLSVSSSSYSQSSNFLKRYSKAMRTNSVY